MPRSTIITGQFPQTRLRRNREHSWTRKLMAENTLQARDLIWPVFVCEETQTTQPTPYLTRYTLPDLLSEAGRVHALGVNSIMLFPVIASSKKDDTASEALNETGLLCETVRALKSAYPNLGVMTDVALDPYTSHGQDGLVKEGKIDNDATLRLLEQHALVQAAAGADTIAPSEMMDGRIGCIRQALDSKGFQNVSLISYAAKYASCLYGPFRDALGSKNCLGQADKNTYQMDPANLNEALREVSMDIQEGTDMVIIKPGLAYLDVVRTIKDTFKIPTIAFQVSGEYAMLQAAAKEGAFDLDQALLETMLCFKRAGADGIITYAAPRLAEILSQTTDHGTQSAASA